MGRGGAPGSAEGRKNLRRPTVDGADVADPFLAYRLNLPTLYHVGTLDPRDKRPGSHEGAGLSVSLHPEAWRSIARLGNRPTFTLSRPSGTFIDVHEVISSSERLDAVTAWAARSGYLRRGRLVELHCQNDSGATVVLLCASYKEARRERDALGDGGAPIVAVERWLMTPRMAKRALSPRDDDHALATDHALSFFVEDTLPEIDGLWWKDTFDPAGLSAPRGVIFGSRLSSWQAELRPIGD